MRRPLQHAGPRWLFSGIVALALVFTAALPPGPLAAPAFAAVHHAKKRLILNDGTHIDVLRFLVRHASQVDWAATRRWQHRHPHGVSGGGDAFQNLSPAQARRQAAQIDREQRAQRQAVQDLMPAVKPGLRLPNEDGVFALDRFQGVPELIHLRQPDGDLNQNPFHSVQPVDVYRMHAFAAVVRIRGVHARVQLHIARPMFYVSLRGAPLPAPPNAFVVDARQASGSGKHSGGGSASSRFLIVRVVRQGQARVIFARRLRNPQQRDPARNRIQTTQKIMAHGHWMRITPAHALAPGEYALVELLGPKTVNRAVWDFGVSPKAPENQGARLPVQSGR